MVWILKELIAQVKKAHIPFAICAPVVSQYAALAALRGSQECIDDFQRHYTTTRNLMCRRLDQLGHIFEYQKPKATFYFWVKCPKGLSSEEMVALLLEQAGIIASPGSGYGEEGEGYIRLAIVTNEERLKEAKQRLLRLKL